MKLQVLGMGCANCKRLTANTEEAVKGLGIEATVEKVEDMREIARFQVMRTPALVVDGKVVLSGRVPSVEEIASMLKA